MTQNRSSPRFGAFPPTPFQARIIGLTRKLPETWLGKRTAFFLRRLALMGQKHPVDVEIFSQKMRIFPLNNVAEKRILFTPQFFDLAERAQLANAIGEDFVFIDIGANVGAYSFFVAGCAPQGRKIVAVEPQGDIFDRLCDNIAFNPDCGITAIRCAVTDRDGEIRLFLDAGNMGEANILDTGSPDQTRASETVPAKSLLSILTEEKLARVDAMKIDVEGAEDLILVAFFENAPRRLWPELIILENNSRHWKTDCIQLCQTNGYATICTTRLNVVLKLEK